MSAADGAAGALTDGAPPPLHPHLAGLAWLVGSWVGEGVGDYPTIEGFRFRQRLEITHDGRPFLRHESRTWELAPDGSTGRPLATELGFWRPVPGGSEVELLLVHATGIAESWAGAVSGRSVELATDLVARTSTAAEVVAGTRATGGWRATTSGGSTRWPRSGSRASRTCPPSSPRPEPPSAATSRAGAAPRGHQPCVPGAPLNGPTRSAVIQPP